MGNPMGEWGYGMRNRMRSKRLRRCFKICRKKIRYEWIIFRNRMRRNAAIRQQERIENINLLAAIVVAITSVYLTMMAGYIDYIQGIQSRIPELDVGVIVLLVSWITYIVTGRIEKGRKK